MDIEIFKPTHKRPLSGSDIVTDIKKDEYLSIVTDDILTDLISPEYRIEVSKYRNGDQIERHWLMACFWEVFWDGIQINIFKTLDGRTGLKFFGNMKSLSALAAGHFLGNLRANIVEIRNRPAKDLLSRIRSAPSYRFYRYYRNYLEAPEGVEISILVEILCNAAVISESRNTFFVDLKNEKVLIQNEFNEKLTPRFAIFSEFSEMERLESVLNRHGLLNMFRVSELENPGILVFLLNTGAGVKAKTDPAKILNRRSVLPDETPSESSIPYRQKLSDFDRQMNTILHQSEIFADALRKDFLEQISLPEELLFPSSDTQGSDVND